LSYHHLEEEKNKDQEIRIEEEGEELW